MTKIILSGIIFILLICVLAKLLVWVAIITLILCAINLGIKIIREIKTMN